MKDIAVIYHKNCPDGFAGAWAAWRKFKDSAEYIPIQHYDPIPAGLKGKIVYFIDIVYPLEVFKIITSTNTVIAIDHHKTAKETVKLASEYVFDQEHSGAVLAWHYFHATKKLPEFLKYIEIRDLWKFRSQKEREIAAAMEFIAYDFEALNKAARLFETASGRKDYQKRGSVALKYKELIVADVLNDIQKIMFHGLKTGVINSPVFKSEIGNRISLLGYDMAIIWHKVNDSFFVSLRSGPLVDVSTIAKKYGGGGHPQASGFVLKGEQTLPWEK